MKFTRPQSRLENGFTLLELLVVIAIIAILAALTMGGFQYAQQAAARNRTTTTHAALQAGLARYNEMHGEYPAPANPEASTDVAGKDMRVGGARMLYQAITGDGDSEIKLAEAGGNQSDGKIDDTEAENIINGSLPKSMIVKSIEGYYISDGWARPFQYVKGGSEDALNASTYDLWSFGNTDSKGPFFYDAEGRRSVQGTATWIKNW
ncbi:MAG TPA: prepilin-type N-terminal cleavage/methylation domain-containing protein [Candidatus Saccharimonadia bacterium]|nr:prepilin-type N-terminal cleavage/methylation domain-containing protein [Candidatus Saccharimonadia bacterium]